MWVISVCWTLLLACLVLSYRSPCPTGAAVGQKEWDKYILCSHNIFPRCPFFQATRLELSASVSSHDRRRLDCLLHKFILCIRAQHKMMLNTSVDRERSLVSPKSVALFFFFWKDHVKLTDHPWTGISRFSACSTRTRDWLASLMYFQCQTSLFYACATRRHAQRHRQ